MPPLPWLLIILGILLFIAICIAIFVWYRRRQRRIALERYALKRARRKLKVLLSFPCLCQYFRDRVFRSAVTHGTLSSVSNTSQSVPLSF